MSIRWLLPLLPLVLSLTVATAADVDAPPPKGHLIIHGGGAMTRDVMDRFAELGGREKGHLIYVPTSNEGELSTDPDSAPSWIKSLGFGKITVLHTRDPKVAATDEFIEPLRKATAIWFSGGRQWRTMDVYLGTKAASAFHDVYHRGGVIAGSSAGATVQGSFLVRGAPEGNQIMMAPGHETGFGFLPDSAIDQHAIARKRLDDMIPVIQRHPHLLGIAIDEATALVVHDGVATVMGKSKVAFYDAKRWQDMPEAPRYVLINTGERFNLKTRSVQAE